MSELCCDAINPGVHRHGLRWVWTVYNSAYGMASGSAWTRKRAVRRAQGAVVELLAS